MDREDAFKVCIFGDESLGKTTLVKRYLTKVFDKDIKMTVGADFYEKDLKIDGKKILLRIWDFGEEHRFKVLLSSFAKGTDGGIFVFDVTRYTSVRKIDDWLSIFEKNVREQQIEIPIIMVGVLTDGKDKRQVSTEEANEIAKKFNLAMYLEISTNTGENVETVFEELTRLIMSKVRKQEKKRNEEEEKRRREEPPIIATEIENLESDKAKKLIKQYEENTGKYAIWRGTVTKGFKKWLKGEKVYDPVSSFKDIPIVKDIIKPEDSHYDILLVNDDLATIRLLKSYFESKDVTCRGVVSGTKALEQLKYNTPKLILTDIIHPGPSGYDLCKKIKSNPKWKNIPVFFCTAISGTEVEKHLAETKADGYIHKPFVFSDFDIILDLLRT